MKKLPHKEGLSTQEFALHWQILLLTESLFAQKYWAPFLSEEKITSDNTKIVYVSVLEKGTNKSTVLTSYFYVLIFLSHIKWLTNVLSVTFKSL